MNELMPVILYCMVMSSTPGPNNMLLTASGAHFGYRETLPQILGINLGGFIQTCLTCMGLGSLFVAYPLLHDVLRVGGALYMIFLAWKLSRGSMGGDTLPRPVSFIEGALFQAVNPKTWLKAITVASVFMPTGMPVPVASLLLGVVSFVVGVPCVSIWALFGMAIRGILNDPRRMRVFNVLMGATLVIMAISLLR